jgi:tRNA threonylcarbamoyladenosine biosynthesis protein TsaE
VVNLEAHAIDLAGTEALGRALARVLRAGDLVLLDGDLGAGKTTLVRSIAVALGVDEGDVSSPTFAIVNGYTGRTPAGAELPIAHLDAYRLSGEDREELDLLGWDRFAPGSVLLIEWGERIRTVLEDMGVGPVARIGLRAVGPEARDLAMELPETWEGRDGMDELRDLIRSEQPDDADSPVQGERTDTVCRVTGLPVPADSPTWPFADERARMADLYGWFSGGYTVSRRVEDSDLEQTE